MWTREHLDDNQEDNDGGFDGENIGEESQKGKCNRKIIMGKPKTVESEICQVRAEANRDIPHDSCGRARPLSGLGADQKGKCT